MYKIFALLFFFLILTPSYSTLKGDSKAATDFNHKKFNSILYFTVGMPFATESQDFFNHYKQLLQGGKSKFDTNVLITLGNKYQFWKYWRIGIVAELFNAKFDDYYSEEVISQDEVNQRNYSQNVSLKSIPIFLVFEYISKNQQFRTYTGAGCGIDISSIRWTEQLETNVHQDLRIGGIHYDRIIFSPSFRFYMGLELGFDRVNHERLLGSFIIEAEYCYFMRETDMFSEINHQFAQKPNSIDNFYTILPYYMGLNIGLTFNFNRR